MMIHVAFGCVSLIFAPLLLSIDAVLQLTSLLRHHIRRGVSSNVVQNCLDRLTERASMMMNDRRIRWGDLTLQVAVGDFQVLPNLFFRLLL